MNDGEADEIPFSADLIHQTQGVYTHFANLKKPKDGYACIDDDQKMFQDGRIPCRCEWLHML